MNCLLFQLIYIGVCASPILRCCWISCQQDSFFCIHNLILIVMQPLVSPNLLSVKQNTAALSLVLVTPSQIKVCVCVILTCVSKVSILHKAKERYAYD